MMDDQEPEAPCAAHVAELDTLYPPPAELIGKAITDHLTDFHLAYLKVATFFCLATVSEKGLDVSPRGGPAGCVHALDRKRIAFADWPGNNRIESMRNIQSDDRVATIFIFPGLEIFMRINGRSMISVDPALLRQVAEGNRIPRTAMVITVEEVIFHCGRAVNRARLWEPDSRIDRRSLPSAGQMMIALGKLSDVTADDLDAHYDHGMKNDLY
nr:MSMEG_1061 family FMN-dependent PPOX-type flavoprotein [Sphingomonas sp. Y57]